MTSADVPSASGEPTPSRSKRSDRRRTPPRARPARSATRKRDGLAEVEATDQVFAALSHSSRRQILMVLHFRGGEMTAGEIAERFACTWPTTSRHLKVLIDAGLVVVEQRGRVRHYRVDRARVKSVVGEWVKWFDETK